MHLLVGSAVGITGFVIVQILIRDTSNIRSNRFALALQVLWLVRFLLIYAKIDLSVIPNPYLIVYDQTLILLDGPLFWLYTRSLVEVKSFKRSVWLHFIPFILLFSYSTLLALFEGSLVQTTYMESIKSLASGTSAADIYDAIFILFVLAYSLVYVFKAVKSAKTYNARILENYSAIENLTAQWVVTFQRMWIILFMFPIAIYFLHYLWPVINTIYLAAAIIFPLVGFSTFFSAQLLSQTYVPVQELQKGEPTKSNQIDKEQEKLLKLLRTEMREKKYYLDEELSLRQLSTMLNMKPAQLSELIKLSEFDNFYDLINSYRVDRVKEELKVNSDQIIQIAYQNGFKTKSTFNKIFKEKTGKTPKEYRSSLK